VFVPEQNRPRLLVESNFEIALFAGLVAIAYPFLGRARAWSVVLVGLIVVLEASRSGSVVFWLVGIYAIVISYPTLRNGWSKAGAVVGALAVSAVTIFVITSRSFAGIARDFFSGLFSSDESASVSESGSNTVSVSAVADQVNRIDRVQFFQVFLQETESWGISRWLFGTFPVTPLSEDGCARLAGWDSLYSSLGDGSCYSVIFHAFAMRVVFDAGLLGLLLAFGLTLYVLRKAKVSWLLSLVVVGIAGANSLSVSGLNNPFVALVVILAILYSGHDPRSEKNPKRFDSLQRAGTPERTQTWIVPGFGHAEAAIDDPTLNRIGAWALGD
jgi:hypothetical protein